MKKNKSSRFKKQVDNFLFDHYIIKTVLHYMFGFLVATIAAAVFAFEAYFAAFLPPALQNERGASGLHPQNDRFLRELSAGDRDAVIVFYRI